MNSWDLFPRPPNPPRLFAHHLGAQTLWLTAEICQRRRMCVIKHLPQCIAGWQQVWHCKHCHPKMDLLAPSSYTAVILIRMYHTRMIYCKCPRSLSFTLCIRREGCVRPLVRWGETVRFQPAWILFWDGWDLQQCLFLSGNLKQHSHRVTWQKVGTILRDNLHCKKWQLFLLCNIFCNKIRGNAINPVNIRHVGGQNISHLKWLASFIL